MTTQKAIQKTFAEIRQSVSGKYVERTDLIDCILFTLLAKQNGCVIGTPGIAKSAVLRGITSLLQEPCFSVLLTKTTMPEEVVGMLDFDSATKGVQKRNITGYLPEAKVGFFDEIWKASSAIRNAMLTIINERVFRNGAEEIDLPLWSCWAASNEYPQSEEDAAMWDRFLVRLEVKEIQETENFRSLLTNTNNAKLEVSDEVKALLKSGIIEKAQQEVKNLPISNEVIDSYEELRIILRNAGVVPSDRRWLASLDMVKSLAYLRGKSQAEKADMSVLENILWEVPEQKETVKGIIMKLVAPFKHMIYNSVQECDDILSNLDGTAGSNLEGIKKINSLIADVKVIMEQDEITPEEMKYAKYVANQFEKKAGVLGSEMLSRKAKKR